MEKLPGLMDGLRGFDYAPDPDGMARGIKALRLEV